MAEWPDEVVYAFIEKVDEILKIIENNPQTFPNTKYSNVHRVVTPQITLFYYIVDLQNIRLVRFWNNHKDPSSFSIK